MRAAALCAAFTTSWQRGGFSGSGSPEAGSSEPTPTATPAEREPSASTSSAPSPDPTTTEPSEPAPIARGTAKIVPRFGRRRRRRRGCLRSAVKIADANYPSGLAAARDVRILFSELWGGQIRIIRRDDSVDPEPWADVNATTRTASSSAGTGCFTSRTASWEPTAQEAHPLDDVLARSCVSLRPARRRGTAGRRYPALRGRFLMCSNDELGMVALRIRRSDSGRRLAMTRSSASARSISCRRPTARSCSATPGRSTGSSQLGERALTLRPP